jgi:hypothetical protein
MMEHGWTRISIVAPTMIPAVLPAFRIDIGGAASEAARARR